MRTRRQQSIVASTNRLLQLPNRRNQLCDSFLQTCYSILAVLKGGLLQAQKTLQLYDLSLEEKKFLQMMINLVMYHLPLPREDTIVLHDCLLDSVHSRQGLLMVLLSISLNPTDLSPMSPPLLFRVIDLEKNVSRATKRPYICFSHPGFQLQYPG